MIKHKKGFSLLEIILVLGIGTAMAFLKFQDMKNEQETVMANAVGSQMKQMGEAVNRYISIRYDKLSTLSSSSSQTSDPGPRICSAAECEITYQTLINEGLLPVSYTGKNAQASSYKIILKRDGTAPNYVINGLITTTLAWKEGAKIRYDLLGRAMWTAGIDSGITRTATVVSGYQGQWSEKAADYSNITSEGLLVYRVGYDSSMYSVYLRRDGTLPMTGDLNMGGNDINNARNITASGTGNFGGYIKSGGNITATTGFGDLISLGGDKVNRDYEMILHTKGLPLIIHDTENSTDSTILKTYGNIEANGNILASKNITATGNLNGRQLTVKNGYGDTMILGGDAAGEDYEIRLSDNRPLTLWRHDGTTSGSATETRFQVWGSQSNRGDLNIAASGAAAGKITASGNILSGGTVSGQYLQPTSTISSGAACSIPGAISKDDKGAIYSCEDLIWQQPASKVLIGLYRVDIVNRGGRKECVLPNSATGDCSCSPGLKSVQISSTSEQHEQGGGGNGSGASYYSYQNIYACVN
ncbi:shufflon system plasmid conjugative transfer pilus tip adhesin PilV [Brenneria populi]